jgi:hypothetical protein
MAASRGVAAFGHRASAKRALQEMSSMADNMSFFILTLLSGPWLSWEGGEPEVDDGFSGV